MRSRSRESVALVLVVGLGMLAVVEHADAGVVWGLAAMVGAVVRR